MNPSNQATGALTPPLGEPPDPFDPELTEAVEEEIYSVLESSHPESSPKRLRIAVEYALGGRDEHGEPSPMEARRRAAGKRARSQILLSCAQIAGGDLDGALPAAAAVELVHNFSLVHDDIEDADEERRHRPSLWMVSGIPQAINTGSHIKGWRTTPRFACSNEDRAPRSWSNA